MINLLLPSYFHSNTNSTLVVTRSRYRYWLSLAVGIVACLLNGAASAVRYPLENHSDLIGEVQVVQARESDTLMDIARAHSMGVSELRLANPLVDVWLPREGTAVTIPSRFLLPQAPRQGMVLNLAEMRLYWFHHNAAGEQQVETYPVGIGRDDRQTPLGTGRVVMKLEDPAWYPTAAVRADYASRGKALPRQVPPGPDNPLGKYALVLDLPGILIHGTNKPDGIGLRVSQGCIRLYPEHIASLVYRVEKGTPVTIVDQPYKVGVVNGELMIEVHPKVYGESLASSVAQMEATHGEQQLVKQVVDVLTLRGHEIEGEVDWDRLTQIYRRADGMPTSITGAALEQLPPATAGR